MLSASDGLNSSGCSARRSRKPAWNVHARSVRKVSSPRARSGCAAVDPCAGRGQAAAVASTTAATSASTSMRPPRSVDTATRSPRSEPMTGGAKVAPGSPSASGDARVGSGEHREQQGQVVDVAGHRPGDPQRLPLVLRRPRRHAPAARPQPVHPAERRRVAQAAAHVGALRERHHAGGQRARRSPARPARAARRVHRVAGGTEDRVERVADRPRTPARSSSRSAPPPPAGSARRPARRGRGRCRPAAASRTSSATRPRRGCP